MTARVLTFAPAGPPDDPARFKRLMLPHLDAAYGFARHLCGDASLAEDLAQEAYLRAFRGFAGYRGGDPRAWLLAIVRSAFLDQTRRPRREVSDDGLEAAPDPGDSPEAALVRAADRQAVLAAVAALPDPFRETLVLRELQEMSYREIGEITGAPIGTVMSRLARARALLACALAAQGGGR